MVLDQAYLLTPGPLTTTRRTREAMLHDWGSWDAAFNQITASLRRDLLAVVQGERDYTCIPLQGSGTFAVEAALGTLVPRAGTVLVPSNGAYCQRILRILGILGRKTVELSFGEDQPVDAERVDQALAADTSITHVALVHCETSTGILNPLAEVAQRVAARRRRLIVDAMSSFAALPIDLREMPVDALVAASGKCLEGVPGMGMVFARRSALEAAQGNSPSLAMDLQDQWVYMERTTQWRYTPPTHVVAALRSALDQYLEEGGQPARLARYRKNCATLLEGAGRMGLKCFLPHDVQAPIIVTLHAPRDARYRFADFYARVRDRGFILYPGKLTRVETFRVGCIGAIDSAVMSDAVAAIGAAFSDIGVTDMAPAGS